MCWKTDCGSKRPRMSTIRRGLVCPRIKLSFQSVKESIRHFLFLENQCCQSCYTSRYRPCGAGFKVSKEKESWDLSPQIQRPGKVCQERPCLTALRKQEALKGQSHSISARESCIQEVEWAQERKIGCRQQNLEKWRPLNPLTWHPGVLGFKIGLGGSRSYLVQDSHLFLAMSPYRPFGMVLNILYHRMLEVCHYLFFILQGVRAKW